MYGRNMGRRNMVNPIIRECFKGKTSKKSARKVGSQGKTCAPRIADIAVEITSTGNRLTRPTMRPVRSERTFKAKEAQVIAGTTLVIISARDSQEAQEIRRSLKRPNDERAVQQEIDRICAEPMTRPSFPMGRNGVGVGKAIRAELERVKTERQKEMRRRQIANIAHKEEWRVQQETLRLMRELSR